MIMVLPSILRSILKCYKIMTKLIELYGPLDKVVIFCYYSLVTYARNEIWRKSQR